MLHRVLPFRAISSFWPAAGFVDTEIGCFMKPEVAAQLVTDALIMAVWRRGKPDALLHHSDQGSLYTSEQFRTLMADHGIDCSMSRSGNVIGKKAIGRPLNTDPAIAERVRQMRADGIGLLKIGCTLGIGTGLVQRLAYTPSVPGERISE